MLPQINTIYSYFRAIKEKDIDKLVDMFEDDAVIQEPFSKEAKLRDKRNFKSFFQIVCLANEELDHDLFFEDATDDNGTSVLCTFQKGQTVSARFSFRFGPSTRMNAKGLIERRIAKLQIQFLSPYENLK
jgi:ketosteroid isomerase-like protein